MKYANWILIVFAGVAVAGCGMKGPLYLPDRNASVVTRPGSTNTTTPPAQTEPGNTTSTPPAPGDTTPSTPKQPQDKNNDDSQSNSTPKR
jgi:predicted small lipoprotein YifL